MKLTRPQANLLWRLGAAPTYVKRNDKPLQALVEHKLVTTYENAEFGVDNRPRVWCTVTVEGMAYLEELRKPKDGGIGIVTKLNQRIVRLRDNVDTARIERTRAVWAAERITATLNALQKQYTKACARIEDQQKQIADLEYALVKVHDNLPP